MENHSGHRIKILRMYIGDEYVSNEFLNFCKNHGIQKKFTVRYTPEQNDVIESTNITIMEMACNMMVANNLCTFHCE